MHRFWWKLWANLWRVEHSGYNRAVYLSDLKDRIRVDGRLTSELLAADFFAFALSSIFRDR